MATAAEPADEFAALAAENARLTAELERLRESERMYRHSAEIGLRVVWSADPEGRPLSMSRLFRHLTGISEEQAREGGWLEAIHPDDRERVAAEWARCLKAGGPCAFEFRSLRSDGSSRWTLTVATPWRCEQGHIRRWYGSTEDIEDERAAARARQEAEERLRESEELYRYTLELSSQVVWTAAADGFVDYLSPRFAEMTGLPPGEPPGKAIHPDDLALVKTAWDAAIATGRPHMVEYRLCMSDGSHRMVRSRAAPRRDKAGRIIRWYGTTEDIEEETRREQARIEAEEKLRESEELYRYTLELSHQLAWTATPGGRLLSLSPRFYALTGIDPAMPLDAAWQSILHPAEKSGIMAEWAAALAHRQPYESEIRFLLADGEYHLYRVRALPRRDADGAVIRWYGTCEDIGERRAAERARHHAEERYQLAARATNDVIWDYDFRRETIHWSEQAAETFAVPGMPEVTPLSWWEEKVHPDDRQQVVNSLAAAAKAGWMRWSASYRFMKGDGEYANVFDRGFLIRGPSGRAIRAVGAMTDLTDRYRAEAEIRRMQGELIHVSRLSAMGTMASTLAHELNQPLTAVANYVRGSRRLLADVAGDETPVGEALASAEAAALRAGEIVRRLRELVARGKVEARGEDLLKLIEEAGVLAFVDERLLGISHRIEVDPAARRVRADRIQIQQVLINLIRNAAQAMLGSPVREIAISAAPVPGGMVEIRVADTGPGIAPEQADTLFSPFVTTAADGMGIGLPISRTIVEAHGGKIWAENQPGGGAILCFTLPAAPSA